jgi:hypothetical protein
MNFMSDLKPFDEQAVSLERKRKEAISRLGKQYVLHPEYVLDPKHSFNFLVRSGFAKSSK